MRCAHYALMYMMYFRLCEIYCIILSVLCTAVLSLEVIHPPLPGTAGTGGELLVSLSRTWDLPTRWSSCRSVLSRSIYAYACHPFMLSMIISQFVLHFLSDLHTCKFCWPLRCIHDVDLYVLSTLNFFMILIIVLFFRKRTFASEDGCWFLHNSFGDMNVVHQIYSILVGGFVVYICMYFILGERLWVCVCVRVCILLCKIEFCMCVFIVGLKLFQLIFCWIRPDFELRLSYLI